MSKCRSMPIWGRWTYAGWTGYQLVVDVMYTGCVTTTAGAGGVAYTTGGAGGGGRLPR